MQKNILWKHLALFVAMVSLQFSAVAQQAHMINLTNRVLHVYLPEYYDLQNQKYDVIYLLDAQNKSLVDLTLSTSRFLAGNSVDLTDYEIPQVVLVGVETEDRGRDFGSQLNAFRKELIEEIVPHIESSYRTSGFNTIIGHSLGGRVVIKELLNPNSPFDGFVTASPAFRAGEYQGIADNLQALELSTPRFWFNSITNLEGERTEEQFRDFSADIQNFFKQHSINKLAFQGAGYELIGHGKALYFTIPEALHFIYSPVFWDFPYGLKKELFTGKMEAYFQAQAFCDSLKSLHEVERNFPRWTNVLASCLLQNGQEEQAIELFKKRVFDDPTSLGIHLKYLALEKGDEEFKVLVSNFINTVNRMDLRKSEKDYWLDKLASAIGE